MKEDDNLEKHRFVLEALNSLEHHPIIYLENGELRQKSIVNYSDVIKAMSPLKQILKENRMAYFKGKLIQLKDGK